MIVRVFGLFEQGGDFVEHAAKSLRILADKTGERILAKDHYCVVKPLYKQKLYNTLLPALIGSGARQSTAHLLALGAIINTIPKSLILSELSKVLPMIMRSLSLSDPELRCNMLEVLTMILEVHEDSADQVLHAQARIFPDVIRYDALHPSKSKVVRVLGKAVDDPKRVVRREAVDTRSKWYKYGAAV
ncbi:hypothetical protein QFC19_002657 [Naganishia cerealis]|uniref:Uncharacterized protein n=1 Tax=Naganishia cerealis TaxID=610337 RepID=A0ACC2W9M9_9TREE|nr:hypothetical protein QFC19_002657 [Naganishia cerealis]